MTDVPRRPEGGSSRGLWVLVLVLLAPAVVVPLWVPLYDKTDPTLWGFPFYYWFQFALIPGAAILTVTAFLVSREADRRGRSARRPVGSGGNHRGGADR